MHHMPMPHRQVVAFNTAALTSPLTQVLIRNGAAGMYEKNNRDRNDVRSAMTRMVSIEIYMGRLMMLDVLISINTMIMV